MPYWFMGLILWFSSGAHSFRMRGQRPRTIADQSRCPNRVIRDVLTVHRPRPVFPGKQTCQRLPGCLKGANMRHGMSQRQPTEGEECKTLCG